MNWLGPVWATCLVVAVILALVGVPIWVSLTIGLIWLILFARALYKVYRT